MSLGVIIPAAGSGQRMKTKINKQYLNLIDRPILAHTINLFFSCSLVDQIVVVVREDELEYCQTQIINRFFNESIKLVAGGKSRRESVYLGLKAFSSIEYVIIHDGARPLLQSDLIMKVIKSLNDYKALVVGVSVKDTIKKINEERVVINTLRRNELIKIQTPQAFAYDLIMEAHMSVPETQMVTDDASLVETIGYPVKVIKGSEENFKITTSFDLTLAEVILKNRRK